MNRDIWGNVYNIQRYSLDDGPGIRTTVFLKGCPLRCMWCSNPESQSTAREFMHRDSVCVRCGACVKACPKNAIEIKDSGEYHTDRDLCDGCGSCSESCLYKAITIMGGEKTVEEVMDIVKRDRIFYETSEGGMTISGGEALFQPEFTKALLDAAKAENIHSCIETTGFAKEDAAWEIFEKCDLIYFDIKSGNEKTHKKYTGVGLDLIRRNLKNALNITNNVVVRIPFIPTVNTSYEDVEEIIKLIMEAGRPKEVHLLPYHNYGEPKYKNLGREYSLK